MIGGTILSFYDWYADLPPASPQVFGDQTDVPGSGDWWNSSYLMLWGTNLPITRTPDAHFMTPHVHCRHGTGVPQPLVGDGTVCWSGDLAEDAAGAHTAAAAAHLRRLPGVSSSET